MRRMHILFTDKDGKFQKMDAYFKTIADAEKWLKYIKAQYWEIGI